MIKHVVMWNIKENLPKEEIMKIVKEKLEALPKEIEVLRKIELGINYKKKETGRDIVLYTEFDTKEDLEKYIVHPAHKEVGKYIREVVCDRVDVDYEI